MDNLANAKQMPAVNVKAKSYVIFGTCIKFSEAEMNYCEFVRRFDEIREHAVWRLKKGFESCGSLEGVYNNWHNVVGDTLYDCIYQEIIQYLQCLGMYDWDSKRLEKYYDTCCYEFGDVLRVSYLDKYIEIVDEKETAIEYRKERKQYRNKAVGIGFGVGGQIKASMKAGAINAVTGMGHSVANMIGNTASRIGASAQMASVYCDKERYKRLEQACIDMVYSIADRTQNLINDNSSIKLKSFQSENISRARALLSSLKEGVIEESRREEAICTILQNFPLYPSVYKIALEEYGDSDNSLKRMAAEFCVDLEQYAWTLMDKQYASVLKTRYETEEQLLEVKHNIIKSAEFYGIDSKNQYVEYLECEWIKIDRKLRTVDGIELPTREEARYYITDDTCFKRFIEAQNFNEINLVDSDSLQGLIQEAKKLDFEGEYYPKIVEERLMDIIRPFIEKQKIVKRIAAAGNKIAETKNVVLLSTCYSCIKKRITFELEADEKTQMYMSYFQNGEELIFGEDCSFMGTWNTAIFVTSKRVIFINKDCIIGTVFGDIEAVYINENKLNIRMKNHQIIQSDILRGIPDEHNQEWGTLIDNIIYALKKACSKCETVFCTKCGARILRSTNFCNVCGNVNKYKEERINK